MNDDLIPPTNSRKSLIFFVIVLLLIVISNVLFYTLAFKNPPEIIEVPHQGMRK